MLHNAGLVVGLFGLIALGGWSAWQQQVGTDTIRFFDIGQGDAALISVGRNTQLLVDAGPDDAVMSQLGRSLPPFDRTIEVAVISHPHADHYRGFRAILGRYHIQRLFISAVEPEDAEYQSMIATARQQGTEIQVPQPGGRLQAGDAKVRFIASGTRNPTPRNLNNASLVMAVTIANRTTLFSGDAEVEQERQLTQVGLPRIDILKVPHHGSKTSSTEGFIEAVRPDVAIISVGAKNRYGHPHPGTTDRLRMTGAHVYRTDQSGSVTIRFRDGGYTVATDR